MNYPTETALDLGWLRSSAYESGRYNQGNAMSDMFYDDLVNIKDQAASTIGFILKQSSDVINQQNREIAEFDDVLENAVKVTKEEANEYIIKDSVGSAYVIYDGETGFIRRPHNTEEVMRDLENMGISREELIDTLVTGDKNAFLANPEKLYESNWLKRGNTGVNTFGRALSVNQESHYHVFIRGHGEILGIRFDTPQKYKVLINTPRGEELMAMENAYKEQLRLDAIEEERLRELIYYEQNREHIGDLRRLELKREQDERLFLDELRELGEMAEAVDFDEIGNDRYTKMEEDRIFDEITQQMISDYDKELDDSRFQSQFVNDYSELYSVDDNFTNIYEKEIQNNMFREQFANDYAELF